MHRFSFLFAVATTLLASNSAFAFVPMALNTSYPESISGNSYRQFQFTTEKAGDYTISLTGAGTNLSWDIWSRDETINFGCDTSNSGADESCVVHLPEYTLFRLHIDEWNGAPARFKIRVERN